MNEKIFGPYLIEADGNHCVIARDDGRAPQPTFYELQCIKNMIWGGGAVAVEVFPCNSDLVDGQEQRHLWLVNSQSVPNLRTGWLVVHEEENSYEHTIHQEGKSH